MPPAVELAERCHRCLHVSLKNYCTQMLQECRSAVAEEAWSQGIIIVLVRPGCEIVVLDRIFWLHWFNIRTVIGTRPDKG